MDLTQCPGAINFLEIVNELNIHISIFNFQALTQLLRTHLEHSLGQKMTVNFTVPEQMNLESFFTTESEPI